MVTVAKRLLVLLTLLGLALPSMALAKGHLVIIGGGKRPDSIIQKIIELAGGPHAKIVIVPNASGDPLDAALYQRYDFESNGAKNVHFFLFDRAQADLDSVVALFDGATGIFFSGGDQRVLADDLLGTKVLAKIHQIYQDGGVISGSSAGAAIMSERMITGDKIGFDEANPDTTFDFDTIKKEVVELEPGFGFVTQAIIDQHFIARQRQNRLMSVALEYSQLLGIGIDEQTAIIVNPDDTFEVMGNYTVFIIDPVNAQNIRTDTNGNLSASNIIVHLLQSGQKFDLNSRQLLP